MINHFTVFGFRKYNKIKIEGLGRVNIFLGNNNVGKTTLLESIFAHSCGTDINQIIWKSFMRNTTSDISMYDFMDKLLNAFYTRHKIPQHVRFFSNLGLVVHEFYPAEIFADLEPALIGSFGAQKVGKATDEIRVLGVWRTKGLASGVELKIPFPCTSESIKRLNSEFEIKHTINARFVDILSHRDREENFKIYSFLKRTQRGKAMEEFVNQLSNTFANITGIDCLPYPDGNFGPICFATKDQGLIPMDNFGDGMQRWFNIIGGMIVYPDAIHCIEEVDATLHPKAQKQLAKSLVQNANKYNNQLFMTSHSIEFVDNMLESIYGEGELPEIDDIRIITLRNDEKTGDVKVRTLTGQEAYESREKYQLELR